VAKTGHLSPTAGTMTSSYIVWRWRKAMLYTHLSIIKISEPLADDSVLLERAGSAAVADEYVTNQSWFVTAVWAK
jgi:hypothetical protein